VKFWDWVFAAVIAGLIVAAVIGTLKWSWTRRSAIPSTARKASGRVSALVARHDQSRHDKRVVDVLRRAEELGLKAGEDLPLRVEGSRPAIITFHPTGRTFTMYADFVSYQSAVDHGEVNSSQAHFGPVRLLCPTGVTKSSDGG
jgi:hypothetical protein